MKLPFFHFSYGSRPTPSRDWGVIVISGVVLLLATLGWHLWLFNKVANGEALRQGDRVGAVTVHTDVIDSVQEVIGKRAEEESRYETGAYHFIDPSK